jgi:DNA-binding transcriptional LysR family regulator
MCRGWSARWAGVSLFHRTTRRVRLTEAGQQLLEETAPLLAGLHDGWPGMDRISVQPDIATGRLQRLLPDWRVPSGGMFAVFPPGRHLSAAAQAFLAFYRDRWSG